MSDMNNLCTLSCVLATTSLHQIGDAYLVVGGVQFVKGTSRRTVQVAVATIASAFLDTDTSKLRLIRP
jgi:hypothetical protein